MRLRTRFLLVMAVFSIVMVAAAVISARMVLARAALRADEERASVLLARGAAVLREEAATIEGTTDDWASWDDTYTFMTNGNRRFLDANLVEGTLESLNVHAIAIYDTNRQHVAGLALDSAGNTTNIPPDTIRTTVEGAGGLLALANEEPRSGFVLADGEIWMAAAAPILTSQGDGPARGTLFMGRRLDDAERERLARVIDPTLRIEPAAPGWPPGQTVIVPHAIGTLQASVALADATGNGRIAMELDVPRVAFAQVAIGVSYLAIWIATIGAGAWLLAVALLNRWVLASVSESVAAIRAGLATAGRSDAPRKPLAWTRNDEIGELFDAVESAIVAVEASAREADRRRAEAVHSQRLAALGTLAAGVAHEINNPNGVIHLNVHVMRRELARLLATRAGNAPGTPDGESADPERVRVESEWNAILSETLAASDRISGIVAALKDFSKPADHAERAAAAAADLVGEAAHWLRHEYGHAGCRLETEFPPDLPLVTVNRQQIVQVFVNLLQNACRSARETNALVRVHASFDPAAETVSVAVADEGRGMSPETIEHALDPFFTTHRSEGGVGLGLSISAAIVSAHGGTLRIESAEGKGAVVTVTLPAAKGAP